MASKAEMTIANISRTENNHAFKAGFTLIELVVVMTIMGIMLTVTIALMSDDYKEYMLRREAKQLQEVLAIAADDAVLRHREWGLFVNADSYNFAQLDTNTRRWVTVKNSDLGNRMLPDPLSLEITSTNRLMIPSANNAAQPPPPIILLSSGQTSAFQLRLQIEGNEKMAYIFQSDGKSGIAMREGSNDKRP